MVTKNANNLLVFLFTKEIKLDNFQYFFSYFKRLWYFMSITPSSLSDLFKAYKVGKFFKKSAKNELNCDCFSSVVSNKILTFLDKKVVYKKKIIKIKIVAKPSIQKK